MPPTQRPTSGDFVTLKEHIESKLDAINKATELAYQSMQARLGGMNEFRDALKDQAAKFVTRDEMNTKLDSIHQQLKSLEITRATLEGKATQTQVNTATIVAIISIAISLIGLLLKLLQPS